MSPEASAEPRPASDAPVGLMTAAASGAFGDRPLDRLRAITRQMATAEDLETVLRSITTAIVERTNCLDSRIFLYLYDHECEICQGRISSGVQVASDQRALHLLATAGPVSALAGPEHRAALDADRPAAEIMRTRTPLYHEDVREDERAMRHPFISRLVRELGVTGIAGYPLDFRGEQLGIIGYISQHPITAGEFEILGIFADQAAMAIKNAYLFRERERYKDRLQLENAYLQDEIRVDRGFEEIVGESAALGAVLRKVRQVSGVGTTVLLTGETGTGKELVARAIHALSPRRDRAMIKVNCGAIPRDLVESELFGHEKGAFTGALQRRIGRFELADRGTLFMDEVGELALDTQVKLLRVLQEREFERVGSTQVMKADVRLIAATNRDLEREVREGRFRADLFYRLNVFPIRIPPLRERPGDMPALVAHFLVHFQRKLAKPLTGLTPGSLARLERYSWPGNIRELQNVLERACVLARSPIVDIADTLRGAAPSGAVSATDAPIPTLADHERMQIRRALAAANGKVHGPDGAAALLGINASTLRSRMQKLGLTKQKS